MAMIQPSYTRPIPPDAELVHRDGKPFAKFTERGKPVVYPLSRDGRKYRKKSLAWYAKFDNEKPIPLGRNRAAAKVKYAKILADRAIGKAVGLDPVAAHADRPLADHLADWEESLTANDLVEEFVSRKVGRVRSVATACEWTTLGDISADAVERHLASLRAADDALPPIPAGQESFRLPEVCTLLGGVTRSAVAKLVQRHRLPATGQGKARRYPLATVAALRERKERGNSAGTSNDWLQACRQFCRWLVDNERLARNPLARLKPMNADTDRRLERGAFTDDEIERLIRATAASAAVFRRRLLGTDRRVIYLVALATGYRADEVASVSPHLFDLNGTPPTLSLPPRKTKNRKAAVQPLPVALVPILREYLAGRNRTAQVWPGKWYRKAAEMLRADLDAAGVPFSVEGLDGPEVRDFHALRCTFITNVVASGADLKQAMTLARHSDPRLTAKTYARTNLGQLAAVVDRLQSVPQSVLPAAGGGHSLTPVAGTIEGGEDKQGSRQTLEIKACDGCGGQEMVLEVESRLRDLNPGPRLYESRDTPRKRLENKAKHAGEGGACKPVCSAELPPAFARLINNLVAGSRSPASPPPDPLRLAFDAADADTRAVVRRLLGLPAAVAARPAPAVRRAG